SSSCRRRGATSALHIAFRTTSEACPHPGGRRLATDGRVAPRGAARLGARPYILSAAANGGHARDQGVASGRTCHGSWLALPGRPSALKQMLFLVKKLRSKSKPQLEPPV